MIKYILPLLLLASTAFAITAKEAIKIADNATAVANAKFEKDMVFCWHGFEKDIDKQIERAAKDGWYFTFVEYKCNWHLILGPDSLKSLKDRGFKIDPTNNGVYVYWNR